MATNPQDYDLLVDSDWDDLPQCFDDPKGIGFVAMFCLSNTQTRVLLTGESE